MTTGFLRGFLLLSAESFADSIRRKTTIVVLALTALTALFIDRCTGAMTGVIEWNGELMNLEDLGPVVGIPIFVMVSLTVLMLSALLSADSLARPLEDGEISIWLARPVSRESYALSRLCGSLGLAVGVAVLLLGSSSLLLYTRQGLPLGPALEGGVACALGALVTGAFSMSISLSVSRIATVTLMLAGIGLVVVSNFLDLLGAELSGWFGAIAHFGPPLAASILHAVAPWTSSVSFEGDHGEAMARLLVWAAAGVLLLVLRFRRIEIPG